MQADKSALLQTRGIYAITCDVNERVYVGVADYYVFEDRWNIHIKDLEKGRHFCKDLQADWDRYGSDAFSFSAVHIYRSIPVPRGLERETVQQMVSFSNVYNVSYREPLKETDHGDIAPYLH